MFMERKGPYQGARQVRSTQPLEGDSRGLRGLPGEASAFPALLTCPHRQARGAAESQRPPGPGAEQMSVLVEWAFPLQCWCWLCTHTYRHLLTLRQGGFWQSWHSSRAWVCSLWGMQCRGSFLRVLGARGMGRGEKVGFWDRHIRPGSCLFRAHQGQSM